MGLDLITITLYVIAAVLILISMVKIRHKRKTYMPALVMIVLAIVLKVADDDHNTDISSILSFFVGIGLVLVAARHMYNLSNQKNQNFQ